MHVRNPQHLCVAAPDFTAPVIVSEAHRRPYAHR